jgi:glycosyltransferase involved in cell wall biosynthesis
MKTYTVYYKATSPLVEYFVENFEHKLYEDPGFFQKMGFGSNDNPDIFFHSGTVRNADLKLMEKSKIIIVNSNSIREEILNRSKGSIKQDQVLVIFPGHDIEKFKKKVYKQAFWDRYKLDEGTSVIYYTGKNLEKTGFIQFLEFVGNLYAENFITAITASPDQVETIKELLQELNMQDKVIVAQEDLFRVADVFILPTTNKTFSNNVLKAMACKNVVFLPKLNHAFELLDNFSIMATPDEAATVHKVNMLIQNKEEMKKIQKQNYKLAKQYTIEQQCEKLKLALDMI